MLAIEKGMPKTLGLKRILENYVEYQKEVITHRTIFDKNRAETRAHILKGLRITLDHIDEIIAIIHGSQSDDGARATLIERPEFSDRQAQVTLDIHLRHLVGLEHDKIENEYQKLLKFIAGLEDILARSKHVIGIIKTELNDARTKFGDARRTELLVGEILGLGDEDLTEEEEIVITLTNSSYVKRMANSEFRAQHRDGRGVQGMGVHDNGFVKNLVSCSTHDTLSFFTNTGKIYRARDCEIPEYGRTAKGIPMINLLGIDSAEKIQVIISVGGKAETDKYLLFITLKGTIKRTAVTAFSNIRSNGLIAISLKEDDELVNVVTANGNQKMIIETHAGYSVTFDENTVRDIGRTASGVHGIRLRENDYVVGATVLDENKEVLVITENGYDKRTEASEYPVKGRDSKGIKTANITEKNDPLTGLTMVNGDEDILLVTNRDAIIRSNVDFVSQTGHVALGVRLMRMEGGAKMVTMAVVEPEEVEEEIVGVVETTENKTVSETEE